MGLPGKFTQLPLRMMTEQVILILLFMFWKLFFHISLDLRFMNFEKIKISRFEFHELWKKKIQKVHTWHFLFLESVEFLKDLDLGF